MSAAPSSHEIITPRTLKGFRDFPPETMIPRERLIRTAQEVYRSYGYSPIDTPALEYLEILQGKGGEESDKQLYRFQDHGGRWVGLRFDLTVPLARFAAQHVTQLGTPFKRYHIGTVWRGENTQRGRYREFMQCDFDTIGTRSCVADVETALVIHDLLRRIGFTDFTIRVNNRQILTGLLESLDLVERSTAVLRTLDKLPKAGRDRVAEELAAVDGLSPAQAEQVLRLAGLHGSRTDILDGLERLVRGNDRAEQGLATLREILAGVDAAGVPAAAVQLDPSIARGLDYYTGTVFETFLEALPGIGSVCSGGRYDNLAGLYTRMELPGIGASLGLDRLLAAMEELGLVERIHTAAEVFLVYFDAAWLKEYISLASRLRGHGFNVEFYPEPKRVGQQLRYADRRGHRVALIAGPEEWEKGECQVKDLARQTSRTVPLVEGAHELAAALREVLAAPRLPPHG